MNKRVLVIGAFDPTGAGGVGVDIRMFHNFRYYVAACVTGIFAQNTRQVTDFMPVPFASVGQQLEALLSDLTFNGLKLSLLPEEITVDMVAELLGSRPIQPSLLDLSLIHPLGHRLQTPAVLNALVTHIMPKVDIVVCNVEEAGMILGKPVEDLQAMRDAASELIQRGCSQVVITSRGKDNRAMDVVHDGMSIKLADAPLMVTENTLGKGAVFSSCVLGNLIKGDDLLTSVNKAKLYIRKAMMHNFKIGGGAHPLNLNTPL
ncbi:MAG TPA: PfkB family carbohydrate kinase [Thermoanaerobaculia bacterium]|nr:PfkB family carbohydrate kinase [Thermoanaerobaculia bacterium]HUM30351.1 PfkB family carbohydrate kinase [Thermoanaerobaculia bacterium]HXK68498.1 PfkB family carbohydrate kinase [Thermoanaerobaculia bacterium]